MTRELVLGLALGVVGGIIGAAAVLACMAWRARRLGRRLAAQLRELPPLPPARPFQDEIRAMVRVFKEEMAKPNDDEHWRGGDAT